MPQQLLQQAQDVPARCGGRAAGKPRHAAEAPLPPPAHPSGSPAAPLPPHLQHAVHKALSDLQAQSLLYPQQCAAAERQSEGAHEEVERRTLAALGGTFNYAAAASELEQARRAAKQLLHPPQQGGATAATAAPAAPHVPANSSSDVDDEEALWSHFEAFSSAVTAEVDRRIAAARLHSPPASKRLHPQHPQGRLAEAAQPAGCSSAKPQVVAPGPGTRRPLGSLQQATAVPPAAERKRGRSPHPPPTAVAEPAAAKARGWEQGRQPAAAVGASAALPVSPPSNKRLRPHVAFGTRCDAPRPVGTRRAKPVQLDAEAAPTPPQLPPVHPTEATGKQPRRQEKVHAGGSSVAALTAPVQRTELLRSLAAIFAGGGGGNNRTAGPSCNPDHQPLPTAAVQLGGSSSSEGIGHMQQMLADLTAALQDMRLPPDPQSDAAAASIANDAENGLQAALRQHGVDPAVAQDASSLLQVVLDQMDAIALREQEQPHHHAAPEAATGGAHGGTCPTAPGSPSVAAAPDAPPGLSPGAEQLCSQFSRLLDASAAELQGVQREVAAVLRVEAAEECISAAALEAAVSGTEAAAAAFAARRIANPPPAVSMQARRGVLAAAAAPVLEAVTRPRSASAGDDAMDAEPPGVADPSSPVRSPALPAFGIHCSPLPLPAPPGSLSPLLAAAADPEKSPTGAAAATAAAAAPAPALAPAETVPVDGWPLLPPGAPALGVPLLHPFCQPQWLLPQAAVGYGWPQAMQLPTAAPPQHYHLQQQELQHGDELWESSAGEHLRHGLSSQEAGVQVSSTTSEQLDSPRSVGSCDAELGGEEELELPSAEPPASVGDQSMQQQRQWRRQEQQQQAALEEAAERAIRQYQQHCGQVQDAASAGAAAAAWDVAMRARGGVAGSSAVEVVAAEPEGCELPKALSETLPEEALPSVSMAVTAAADAEGAAGTVQHQGAAAVPILCSACTALPVRPAPHPYNPLKAAAERAAAARLEEEAAGWRRLRQRADNLALWHEYAVALGLEAEAEAHQEAQPQLPAAAAHCSSVGMVVPAVQPQHRCPEPAPQQRLWQLGQPFQPEEPPAVPETLPSPLAPPSTGLESSSSGTPASSSMLSSVDSSSYLPTESSISSGVGARHKARALRYRLLRRRLEAAAVTHLPPLTDAPSETDCLSPWTEVSLSTPAVRPPSSEWVPVAEEEAAITPAAPAAALGLHSSWRHWQQEEQQQEGRFVPIAEAEAQQPAEALQAQAEFTPCPAAAALPSGLGDHLSDATPSDGGLLGVTAVVERRRLLSGSSCSTLQEVPAR